jgi:predicted dehydrogenase
LKNILFVLVLLISAQLDAQEKTGPVKLAVAGLSHGHNGWILGRKNDDKVVLVGVYEADQALAQQLMKQYNLDPKLFYTDLNKMLQETKPEGVLAYGTTYQHLSVVEVCAPKGIPVMVEKPLATTVEHANRMLELSKKHNVLVLTNYETSWYPTTDKTFELTKDDMTFGKIRKVVVHDGHQGPREIGVPDYFFNWLTDPVQNGGGALTDFGCYGANLMTYLMRGEKPTSVTAVLQQYKPKIYPKVDDEATIIVTYPSAQCIIQASWNWPYGRKDMAVYGDSGYAITMDSKKMVAKSKKNAEEQLNLTPEQTGTYTSPFLYFADVIRGKLKPSPYSPYTLENNMVVVKILDAARRSAAEGKTIKF